jgi:hypothetical protein
MPNYFHPDCPKCRKPMELIAWGTTTFLYTEGISRPLPENPPTPEYRIFSCAACVEGMSVDYCPNHGGVLEHVEKNYDYETLNPTGGPGHITRQRRAKCPDADCQYSKWHSTGVKK